jgi:uncharacterized metal-binding protein YceD (DUF177 family)
MAAHHPPQPPGPGAPFSRPFVVAELQRDRTVSVPIGATPAECAAVAASLGLEAVTSFEADYTLTGLPRGVVGVRGEVRAHITQICVVSLDPFDSDIVETVEAKFAPPTPVAGGRQQPIEAEVSALGDDEPDPIVDGKIDLGALSIEFLALGLDPYPRKPGVEFVEPEVDALETPEESPFAALAKLKNPPQ